jgi:5-formyltetrahydrofolate cyclo-ligase
MKKSEDSKSSVRRRIRIALLSLTQEYKQSADSLIRNAVLRLPYIQDARTICSYTSFPSEVNTRYLNEELIKAGKTIIDPESAVGKQIDCFIVPGLAFDQQGNRLGRGRGFYDKLLNNVSVPKIALAYDIQIIAEVPVTKYDVPVTVVITEIEIIQNNAQ